MSGRLSAAAAAAAHAGCTSAQTSFRRSSNSKRNTGGGGSALGSTQASSSRHAAVNFFGGTFRLQSRFASSDPPSDDGSAAATPLITRLDKYSSAELKEYRQIFNMFDTDRSGAIGLDELENAIRNLGLDPKQIDVEMLMREADKRGNQQIDFDEFCEVIKTTSEKTQTWNEVIKQCFDVFNRSETGFISLRDFEFVLRELGEFRNTRLVEEIFAEFDVNNDRIIDFEEFSFLVKSYLTDEDVV